MTPAKRAFDLIVAAVAAVLLWPLALLAALAILLLDGPPVFYPSARMKDAGTEFTLWKFRTMRPAATDTGVTGGDKADRISRSGHVLRKLRLDELPQLYNVLRGDMSLVGPRPPLRRYVEARPDLYAAVLRSRPGLTGLATLRYRRHEAALLAACTTGDDTHRTYLERCVPRKATLDLIYQRHHSLCFDAAILLRTLMSLWPGMR